MRVLPSFLIVSSKCVTLPVFNSVLCLRSIFSVYNRQTHWKEVLARKNITNVSLFRRIHSTGVYKFKIFEEGENNFAHQVFENLPVYSQTLAPITLEKKHVDDGEFQDIIKENWDDKTTEAVCCAFETLSHYISCNPQSISGDQFSNLCRNVVKKTSEMDDEDLLRILSCLRMWPMADSISAPNFVDIWTAIDKECVKRLRTWDLNKVLYVSDHWYRLHLVRKTDFMWFGNFKLGKKPERLLPHQLIQCMFYINTYRRWHPVCSKYDFEYSVEKCFNNLTLDEIAIFAMGFFKSQTKIHSGTLISEILNRTINEVNNVHSITIAAILKVLRYSLSPNHSDVLYHLMDKLRSQVHRLSLLSVVHVALAGTNVQVFNRELMQLISQRFCDEISTARLKDLERFTLALSQYDYNPKTSPCIYNAIIEQLKSPSREAEILEHPKCLSRCLYYLSQINMYQLELIDRVLQPEFIRNAYGKNEFAYGLELLGLDIGLEVECQQYKGARLPQKIRKRIAKANVGWVPSKSKGRLNMTDRFMLEIMDNLEDILGRPEYMCAIHILPQNARADIVFGVQKTGRPCNIPVQLQQLPLDAVKPAPKSNGTTWYAIVVGGWNLLIRGENRPIGTIATKIRQLELLGYTPLLVSWFDWTHMQAAEKKEYLENMIKEKQPARSAEQY